MSSLDAFSYRTRSEDASSNTFQPEIRLIERVKGRFEVPERFRLTRQGENIIKRVRDVTKDPRDKVIETLLYEGYVAWLKRGGLKVQLPRQYPRYGGALGRLWI